MQYKICFKCNTLLSVDKFSLNKSGKHSSWCRDCKKAYNKKYFQANKKHRTEYWSEYYRKNRSKVNDKKRQNDSIRNKKHAADLTDKYIILLLRSTVYRGLSISEIKSLPNIGEKIRNKRATIIKLRAAKSDKNKKICRGCNRELGKGRFRVFKRKSRKKAETDSRCLDCRRLEKRNRFVAWYRKNRIKASQLGRIKSKKWREKLTDAYVLSLIKKTKPGKETVKDDDIVEAYRELIKLKRLIKLCQQQQSSTKK